MLTMTDTLMREYEDAVRGGEEVFVSHPEFYGLDKAGCDVFICDEEFRCELEVERDETNNVLSTYFRSELKGRVAEQVENYLLQNLTDTELIEINETETPYIYQLSVF